MHYYRNFVSPGQVSGVAAASEPRAKEVDDSARFFSFGRKKSRAGNAPTQPLIWSTRPRRSSALSPSRRAAPYFKAVVT